MTQIQKHFDVDDYFEWSDDISRAKRTIQRMTDTLAEYGFNLRKEVPPSCRLSKLWAFNGNLQMISSNCLQLFHIDETKNSLWYCKTVWPILLVISYHHMFFLRKYSCSSWQHVQLRSIVGLVKRIWSIYHSRDLQMRRKEHMLV